MIRLFKNVGLVLCFFGALVNFGFFIILSLNYTQTPLIVVFVALLMVMALLVFISAVLLAESLGFVK